MALTRDPVSLQRKGFPTGGWVERGRADWSATGPAPTTICRLKKQKPADLSTSGLRFNPGSVLLSHCLTAAVASALESLTSVFEMGTGGTPQARPPGTRKKVRFGDLVIG